MCLSLFGFVSMNALLILSATKTALINFTLILALLLFFPDPVPFSSDPLMLRSRLLLDIHKSTLTGSEPCVGAVRAIQYIKTIILYIKKCS